MKKTLAIGIESKLSKVIGDMPDSQNMPPDQFNNYLVNKGVKKTEIEASQIVDRSRVADKVDKELATKLDDSRQDKISFDSYTKEQLNEGVNEPGLDLSFSGVTTHHGYRLPRSYRVRLLKADVPGDDAEPKSSHFTPNSAHVRDTTVADYDFGEGDTRIVHELQSDHYQNPENPLEPKTSQSKDNYTPVFKRNWREKVLEHSIVDAANSGQARIAIPIKGVNKEAQLDLEYKLVRPDNVQKTYETDVMKTINKVGNKVGTVRTVVKDDGIEYAVIDFEKDHQFSLYSNPLAGAGAAYAAYQAGMPQEEVTSVLSERYGFDDDDIEELQKYVQVIDKGVQAGFTPEEMVKKLEERFPNPVEVETKEPEVTIDFKKMYEGDDTVTAIDPFETIGANNPFSEILSDKDITVRELHTSLKSIYPVLTSDISTSIPTMLGNSAARQRHEQARIASRQRIIDIAAQKYGKEFAWKPDGKFGDTWQYKTPNGEWVTMNDNFWEDLKAESGEILGGIAAGLAAGKKLATRVPHPVGKAATVAAGGIGGAMAGSLVDQFRASVKIQEDLEWHSVLYKTLNAAELALVGEVVAGTGIKVTKEVVQKVVNLKNNYMSIQARKGLQVLTGMDKESLDELVEAFEKHATLEGNKNDRRIQAALLTKPGLQNVVKHASTANPSAGRNVSDFIEARTKSTLNAAKSMDDRNVAKFLQSDLRNLEKDAKNAFASVRKAAATAPNASKYMWDVDEVAVMPILEDFAAKARFKYPEDRERFVAQMTKLKDSNTIRDLDSLLDMRQKVNEFLFNRKIAEVDDKKLIRGVVNTIDAEIKKAANIVFDNPKQWLQQWNDAKLGYTQMKKVKGTYIYRTLFNEDGTYKNIDAKQTVDTLAKQIGNLDGGFEFTIAQLPKAARANFENAIFDNLAERFAVETTTGGQAIDFVKLNEKLQTIPFTSKNARVMKKAVETFSEVFRNDPGIASKTLPHIEKETVGWASSLLQRAKLEAVTSVWSRVKSVSPIGTQNKVTALVNRAEVALDNPLNMKNFQALVDELDGDINATEALLKLQRETAEAKANSADQGAYIKVKVTPTKSVYPHRIVTLDAAAEIANQERLSMNSPMFDPVLKKYGYQAIQESNDRARLLK